MESEVAIHRKARPVVGELSLPARISREIAPHEVLLLLFALLFSAIALVAQERVTEWPEVIVRMIVASILIFGMNIWSSIAGGNELTARWPRRARLIYLFPLIPIYFKAVEHISYAIHGHDFDSMLIAADRMLFGTNPTVWLMQHFPTWPWLTEYMMFSYSLFYFLPLALAFELYLRARREEKNGTRPFSWGNEGHTPLQQVVFIIVFGFMLSYLSYILLPAIGPRFTLHNFFDLSKDLPGLLLTEPLRTLLNRGENILPSMSMAEVLHRVTRDAFPSGHADITLLTIILAFQFRAQTRWYIAILGSSLIFSTVYLRYHYVIDLVGGIIMAMITLYTWKWVREQMIAIKARFT